jgi:hypothetical protein
MNAGWREAINVRLNDIEKLVGEHVSKLVDEQYDELLEDATIYPERKALGVHIWAFDQVMKRFDLERVLLDWFDVESDQAITSKEDLLEWASGLERIAARLRECAAAGRHADPEDL